MSRVGRRKGITLKTRPHYYHVVHTQFVAHCRYPLKCAQSFPLSRETESKGKPLISARARYTAFLRDTNALHKRTTQFPIIKLSVRVHRGPARRAFLLIGREASYAVQLMLHQTPQGLQGE